MSVDVETQLDDVVQQGTEEQLTTETPVSEEPFLRVNDRTVYKTREDALKGLDEAGKRISTLSAWEKEARNWGLDKPQALN